MNEDNTMTAICIYEYICDSQQVNGSEPPNRFWVSMSDNIGAYALRQMAIDLVRPIEVCWQIVHPNYFDDAFDWEFIPQLIDDAIKKDEKFFEWPLKTWIKHAMEIFCNE